MSRPHKNSSGTGLIRRRPNSDRTIIPFIKFGPLFVQEEEGSSVKKAKEEAWDHVVKFSESNPATVKEMYIFSIRNIEDKAKESYDRDPVLDELSNTDFRDMMIKDSCLFLQLSFSLFRKSNVDNNHEDVTLVDFPHLKNSSLSNRNTWIESMLHVGNQIPLVVIREILKKSYFRQLVKKEKWKEPSFDPVKKALFRILLSPVLHKGWHTKFPCVGKRAKRLMHWTQQLKECCDVLHGIHLLFLGPEIDPEKEEYDDDDDGDHNDDVEENRGANDHNDDVEENRGANDENIVTNNTAGGNNASKKANNTNLKNVIELKQAGIHFSVTKEGIRGIMFKSNLVNPKLYLPPLFIGSHTELLLEHLKQYEQNLDTSLREVSSYLMFMRNLVCKSQDAKILALYGIIKGNVKYIQKLPAILERLVPPNDKIIDTSLSPVEIEINSFYLPPWVTSYYTLLFLVTFLTMIISTVQMVYAMLQYHKAPSSPCHC